MRRAPSGVRPPGSVRLAPPPPAGTLRRSPLYLVTSVRKTTPTLLAPITLYKKVRNRRYFLVSVAKTVVIRSYQRHFPSFTRRTRQLPVVLCTYSFRVSGYKGGTYFFISSGYKVRTYFFIFSGYEGTYLFIFSGYKAGTYFFKVSGWRCVVIVDDV